MLKCWSLFCGYAVMFVFLPVIGTGSSCEAPSSPLCFRKTSGDSVYMCEWSIKATESNMTFDLYVDDMKFGGCEETRCTLNKQLLITTQTVDIWVKAHAGNSSCASPRTSAVLEHTIKYEAPRHISVSWTKNNVSLIWAAAEQHPAIAEMWFRRDNHPTDPWDKRLSNTTYASFNYQVTVGNLFIHSAYRLQIRQRSTQAQDPLWSSWSEVTVPAGSTCESLSSPQCFRKTSSDSVFTCEWSMNATESDVTFDLYFEENKLGSYKETRCQITEEQLIRLRTVDMWVKAHVRNFSCASPRMSVLLNHTIKYEAPRHLSVSWINNNLNLTWTAAETHPALAEIWFRRDGQPTDPWHKIWRNTNSDKSKYHVVVGNLSTPSAYRLQIRQRSARAQNPLWSSWSEVTVPAALEREPEVTMAITHLNGTRKVTLSWKPMPRAAAVTGVTYILETAPPQRCTCGKEDHSMRTTEHTTSMYVSYSAVNISVYAKNTVGSSPPAVIQVPPKLAAEFKACDNAMLEKLNIKACHEWYEFQNEDSWSTKVLTLSTRRRKKQKKQIRRNMKDYVRYLYFEHRCYQRKPHTVQMCIFYQKQRVPHKEPGDFVAFGETETSAELSWKAIPLVEQQGHLTHYSLCSIKVHSPDEPKDCRNISAQWVKYHLKNLTPGSKYNISLAGVTEMGEGPKAIVTINTLPEKPLNVWLSFSLLFGFFLLSTLCTVVLNRIKNKIFPPVPKPVIPDFNSHHLENQEMLEEKEEVHDLMLLHPQPELKPVSEDADESSVLPTEWHDSADEDMGNQRGDSKMSRGTSNGDDGPDSTDQMWSNSGDVTDLEQVDNEIAMLIYRNGLVFDVKTDST